MTPSPQDDPKTLVSTDWLAQHLRDPDLRVLDASWFLPGSGRDAKAEYQAGHIPGARFFDIDEIADLRSELAHMAPPPEKFISRMRAMGVGDGHQVVVYDGSGLFSAARVWWTFRLMGKKDVAVLDGGFPKWQAEGRELTRDRTAVTASDYPVVERDDAGIRAYKDEVLDAIGRVPMIDVRSPAEYTGERTHMPDYPEEGALRGGHIPTAASVPWARAAAADGRFKGRDELAAIYHDEAGLTPEGEVIAYCRIGERSSHTWFVLTHLLGHTSVKNYDGSWTEYGNAVRTPIVTGTTPLATT
mgnify:CR=1 FL=1